MRNLGLMRLLRSYDEPSDKVLLEDIPENAAFQLGNKRFIKKKCANVTAASWLELERFIW